MRLLIEISETDINALDAIAQERGLLRPAVVREAISDYLARHRSTDQSDGFGSWKSGIKDGLTLQNEVRDEWEICG